MGRLVGFAFGQQSDASRFFSECPFTSSVGVITRGSSSALVSALDSLEAHLHTAASEGRCGVSLHDEFPHRVRLEALDRDDEEVDALRGDILAIARLRAVIEGHLAEESCLRADEGVVRLREEYSRRLAFSYYPQLEACRAARRAARSSASPQPATAPSGSTGSSGRVLPPAEL